ncbi:MAG: ATP-binding protein [Haloarculaceae archaeon]
MATPEIAVTEDGSVTLPVEKVLTGRAFLTGKSGVGKSNSISVVVEELLDRGVPLLVVDTDGEYVGLKDAYNVLHAGAQADADVQVTPADGGSLARVALTRNVPVLLDVSEFFDPAEARQLVANVARTLYTLEKQERKPFLLVLEECHEFIPQTGSDDVAEMLIRVAKRGRKRGLGVAGLSQRPADVDKAFITQADWLVWHRLTWPNDVRVAREVLGSEYAGAIEDLDTGEAFLQTDWDASVRRVEWRRKRTRDLGAAPSVEKVLGSTPEDLSLALAAFDEEGDDAADGDETATTATRRTIATYAVTDEDSPYAQLGTQAMTYLGADADDTLALDTAADGAALVGELGATGEWTYSVFERSSGRLVATVGPSALTGLGATAGDRLAVRAADGGIRLTVVDDEGGSA